jgi:cytoskeleton protein RodZ
VVDTEVTETALFPERVGDRLRAARIKAGLDLNDIATKTRVPLRHLEGIEAGDYSHLPSLTYCIGFARAYARAVGVDEKGIPDDVRAEVELSAPETKTFVEYEVSDPARIPGKTLAWTAAGICLLFAIGVMIWFSQRMADPRDTAPVVAQSESDPVDAITTNAVVPVVAPVAPTGQVVLTALKPVWLKIYEAEGSKRLFEKEMAIGESFTVPADAVRPQIVTGRPEALKVTIGGTEVAALGPPEKTIADLDISATALAARPVAQPVTTAQP